LSEVLTNPYMGAVAETWITTAGTLSYAVYYPAGKGDKTDGWYATGNLYQTPTAYSLKLDIWNGTAWADSGNNNHLNLNGSCGCGTSAAITVAGSNADLGADPDGCETYNGSSWTTKANMDTGKGTAGASGTYASFIVCGGEIAGGSRTAEVQEYDLAGDAWSGGVSMPSGADTDGVYLCACDGTAINNTFNAGGRSTDYTITASTASFNGTAWTSTPADLDAISVACVGGGTPSGFWKMGGDPVASNGKVAYYDGTSWTDKTDCLLIIGRAGGANNGGTNPIVMGGTAIGVSGNWTSGQYWG